MFQYRFGYMPVYFAVGISSWHDYGTCSFCCAYPRPLHPVAEKIVVFSTRLQPSATGRNFSR